MKVNAERQYAVPDPDLDFFRPFGPQFSQRIGGGGGGGGGGGADPSPVSTTDTENTV